MSNRSLISALALATTLTITGIALADTTTVSAPPTPTTTTTVETTTTLDTPTTTTVETTTTTTLNPHAQTINHAVQVLTNPYQWNERSPRVTELQTLLGINTDGHYGPQTSAAHHARLTTLGLPTNNAPTPPVHTTRTYNDGCPGWEQLALSIGWPAEQIPKLSHITYRESRCDPTAWNQLDPGTGSRGLTQINSFWCTPNKNNPTGFLQAHGALTTCDDLFNPAVSLTASLIIWQRSGWNPWGG